MPAEKKISFVICFENEDVEGNYFPDDAERPYQIDFKDLKKFCDNDLAKQNPNTLGEVKGKISEIIKMIYISALRIVYEKKITILESEIKNKCSDESWLTYKEIRDVIPLIAKMAEHLKSLYQQTHGNIDADVNRKQIDSTKVLQTQVNTFGVDLKKFKYDLSLIEDDIKKFKEKIEANENEGNLKDFLERLQQNCANQLEQVEALISTQNCNLEMLKEEIEARAQETKELVKSLEHNLREKSEENTELRERCAKLQETEARAQKADENLRQTSKENTELRERCEKLQQETEARAQETEKFVKSLQENLRQKSEENTELRESCAKGHNTCEVVCLVLKRMERMVKNCSENHQECPCCVLQGMLPDQRDGLVGEWEVKCVCCRCLPKNVRNVIDDITKAIQLECIHYDR